MIHRNSSLILKSGHLLRNRIVIPAMASQTADLDGFATERTLQHYQRLCQAKVAILFVEYTYVDRSGRGESHQLGVSSDQHIEGLQRIARVIKKSGALAALQLVHCGGKSSTSLTGQDLMGPSAIAIPVKDNVLETPRPLLPNEIEEFQNSFVRAADRAWRAGFDLVELHSAHGYGLNQWISPVTNQRQDGYGGDRANRARMLLEIVEKIKSAHPQGVLSVRMAAQDYYEGGITLPDSQWLAKELEQRGVDILNVSSGIGGWRRPQEKAGEGYLVEDAHAIQKIVQLPVIGVGGISSGLYVDRALELGHFSLAAVGRAILEDPRWTEREGII